MILIIPKDLQRKMMQLSAEIAEKSGNKRTITDGIAKQTTVIGTSAIAENCSEYRKAAPAQPAFKEGN